MVTCGLVVVGSYLEGGPVDIVACLGPPLVFVGQILKQLGTGNSLADDGFGVVALKGVGTNLEIAAGGRQDGGEGGWFAVCSHVVRGKGICLKVVLGGH